MNATAPNVRTTNNIGFFNNNKWTIFLAVSELRINRAYAPGEYVTDDRGRKINDPILEKYCGPLRLSKQESPEPVEIITTRAQPLPQIYDGHAVREVTQFTHDLHGVRRPVMPKTSAVTRPPENQDPVKGMSVQEAKQRGLIKPTRAVPEDYGVSDTAGAPIPVDRLPPIKYATDTSRVQPAKALPPARPETPEGAALQQELREAAQVNTEEPGFVEKVARTILRPKPQPPAVEEQQVEEEAATELGEEPSGRPAWPESQEEAAAEEALPEPPMEETQEQEPPPKAPPVSARPKVPAFKPPTKPFRPMKPAMPKNIKPFVCSECGAGYRFRSELEVHARAKHAGLEDSIMEAYPAE